MLPPGGVGPNVKFGDFALAYPLPAPERPLLSNVRHQVALLALGVLQEGSQGILAQLTCCTPDVSKCDGERSSTLVTPTHWANATLCRS